jgi:hypothetical protein
MTVTRLVLTGLFLAGVSSADVMSVSFNTSVGALPIPGSAPYATATFTLNPDLTISVDVAARAGLFITWFDFNKPSGATITGITPAPVFSGPQIVAGFDEAGFPGACLIGGYCFDDFLTDNFYLEPGPFGTSDLSFTLNRAGGFASLSDLVNGNVPPGYSADNIFGVILTDVDHRLDAQRYAAIATAPIPEPSSLILFFTALVSVIAIGRGRQSPMRSGFR